MLGAGRLLLVRGGGAGHFAGGHFQNLDCLCKGRVTSFNSYESGI